MIPVRGKNPVLRKWLPYLKQSQYRLGGLGCQAQRGGAQRLPRLQHQHVGPFLIHVGIGQVAGTVLQGVDHVVGEILANGDSAQVGGEFLRLGPQAGRRTV